MDRSTRGRKAREKGRLIEYVALVHLMLKVYRILGFRIKIPKGVIDMLEQKGNRLAVVEVKSRTAHDIALESVSITQQETALAGRRARVSWRNSISASTSIP